MSSLNDNSRSFSSSAAHTDVQSWHGQPHAKADIIRMARGIGRTHGVACREKMKVASFLASDVPVVGSCRSASSIRYLLRTLRTLILLSARTRVCAKVNR